MINNIEISTVAIVNQASLQINFNHNWYQEDVEEIKQHLFSLLSDHHIIEAIIGADREYFRFTWQQEYFILNFECYSQSCWIENETTPNAALLEKLKSALTQL